MTTENRNIFVFLGLKTVHLDRKISYFFLFLTHSFFLRLVSKAKKVLNPLYVKYFTKDAFVSTLLKLVYHKKRYKIFKIDQKCIKKLRNMS